MIISIATDQDREEIIQLLEDSKLPASDISFDKQKFRIVREGNMLVSVSAIEGYSKCGIFRFFAVREEFRNKKIGAQLYEKAIGEAKEEGIHTLFQLTNTADGYFQKKGWKRIDRINVPAEVLQSQEFASICPQSAVCMKLEML